MANPSKCNDQMPFFEFFGKEIWEKICKCEIPQIDIIMDLYDTGYHHNFYYAHNTWFENNLINYAFCLKFPTFCERIAII